MTTNEIFEKLMYTLNRAVQSGTSVAELIGILECVKHGLAASVVQSSESQSTIVPVTVLHDGFGKGEGPR